jgi:hypothetical protein
MSCNKQAQACSCTKESALVTLLSDDDTYGMEYIFVVGEPYPCIGGLFFLLALLWYSNNETIE